MSTMWEHYALNSLNAPLLVAGLVAFTLSFVAAFVMYLATSKGYKFPRLRGLARHSFVWWAFPALLAIGWTLVTLSHAGFSPLSTPGDSGVFRTLEQNVGAKVDHDWLADRLAQVESGEASGTFNFLARTPDGGEVTVWVIHDLEGRGFVAKSF